MKKIIFLLFCLSWLSMCYAYELSGTMEDNNDGTYSVNLSDANGHQYIGMGTKQDDGTLTIDVAVEGEGSETYLGLATPNPDGSYTLSLHNNASGEPATGTLTKD